MSLISRRTTRCVFGNPTIAGYDSKPHGALSRCRYRIHRALPRADVEGFHIMDDAAALTLMNIPNIVISDPGISGAGQCYY